MSSGTAPSAPTYLHSMEEILNARGKWDEKTVKNQRRQIQFGFVTALLGPFAVLCLSLQILEFPDPNGFAIGLILMELLALLATLLLGLWQIGRSHHNSYHKWIEYRVRTEVLRREQFLLQARVGPYLTEHDPGNAVRRRLEVIDNREDPMELILLQHPEGKPWRDELEDKGPGNTVPPHPNLLECLKTYLDDRLRDQRNWFRDRSASHAERDKWLENGAKLALALALVVAAMHLILLVRTPPRTLTRVGSFLSRCHRFQLIATTLAPKSTAARSSTFSSGSLLSSYRRQAQRSPPSSRFTKAAV